MNTYSLNLNVTSIAQGARKLNKDSRCCGRKVIRFGAKNDSDAYFFCNCCNRAYDANSRQQVENFAWKKLTSGAFVWVDAPKGLS